MPIAVYPGTFDPITNGHCDLVERASKLFDKVILAVAVNIGKHPAFDLAQRVELAETVFADCANVEVKPFNNLLVEFVQAQGGDVILRGLRAVSDFEYEFQMALMNRSMAEEIDTVFLMPDERYTYLNSSIVRNVASFKGDIRNFVTNYVAQKLINKFKEESAHELDR